MHLPDLKRQSLEELTALAVGLGIEVCPPCGGGRESALRRQELIVAILDARCARREAITADGVLEILPDGFGFLRALDGNYQPCADDIYVSPSQIRRFALRTGDTVSGQIRPPKESERYYALLKVHDINGDDPEVRRQGRHFDGLTPLHPDQPFALERAPEAFSTRLVDLFCPLGKGQRCLIAGPPRTGKSVLLQDLAAAITHSHPEVAIMVVLVDARPEEVVEVRRRIPGEVVASTFDEAAVRHVQVAEIVVEKAKRLVEGGRDVVVLIDSLTRLARAYRAVAVAAGKVSSDGPEVPCPYETRRLLAAARNLAEGGSLGVLATAQTETGARADDLFWDRIAGTENALIRLDRTLMERRVFPCIDLRASGTHREERLLTPERLDAVRALRAQLAPLDPVAAIERLRAEMRHSGTNEALLERLGGAAKARGGRSRDVAGARAPRGAERPTRGD